MIRCIPVDGSEPFEVENDAALDRFTARDDHIILRAERIADIGSADEWTPRFSERTIACRIESWRERAERLERELDIVRLARDWSEAQHSFEHGDPDAMTDIGAIEAELKTLGVTREEAMQL